MKRLALAMAVATFSAQTFADTHDIERPYAGVDYQMGIHERSGGEEANPTAVRLRAGTELSPYFSVEAHAAFGTASDAIDLPGVTLDVELQALYAVFLRPQLPLGDVGSLYALLGYSYADLEATSSNELVTPSTSGFQKKGSFGVGADLKVYKNVRLNVDYVEYIDGYKAVSGGLRFNF